MPSITAAERVAADIVETSHGGSKISQLGEYVAGLLTGNSKSPVASVEHLPKPDQVLPHVYSVEDFVLARPKYDSAFFDMGNPKELPGPGSLDRLGTKFTEINHQTRGRALDARDAAASYQSGDELGDAVVTRTGIAKEVGIPGLGTLHISTAAKHPIAEWSTDQGAGQLSILSNLEGVDSLVSSGRLPKNWRVNIDGVDTTDFLNATAGAKGRIANLIAHNYSAGLSETSKIQISARDDQGFNWVREVAGQAKGTPEWDRGVSNYIASTKLTKFVRSH